MAHGIALITINAIVFVLGSLGNLLVCLAIATNSHLRRASSYLLFSSAIADLIVTLICEPLLMEFIIQRTFLYDGLQSEPVPFVLHFNVSFLCHLSVTYGGYQSWSICCRCVPTRTQKLHGEIRTKGHAYSILINSDFSVDSSFRFVVCHSLGFLFSDQVSLFGNPCLQPFLYFLFLLSDRGFSAALQEEKKATQQNSKRFCETEFSRTEVRVSCTLAIAIGIFTACWVPSITVMFATMTGKPLLGQGGPLDMWPGTLALSNSLMNFLIYSAKIRDFKDAYVDIFWKMLRL